MPDAGAHALHREFTFTRSDTGQHTPPHTLAWALPAASLLGPYPHAHEAAARLCRDYTITRREA